MPDKELKPHRHTGQDAPQVDYRDLVIFPEAEIAEPSGGVTVDSNARAAINSILELLRTKRLMK